MARYARMVDDNTKKLVQDSFSQVTPIAETAAAMFLRAAVRAGPVGEAPVQVRHNVVQGRLLMQTIGAAVAGLDDLPALTPIVQDLGVRHARYGVQPEHYDTVGEALLWTLGQGLGRRVHPGGQGGLDGSLRPAGYRDAGCRRFPRGGLARRRAIPGDTGAGCSSFPWLERVRVNAFQWCAGPGCLCVPGACLQWRRCRTNRRSRGFPGPPTCGQESSGENGGRPDWNRRGDRDCWYGNNTARGACRCCAAASGAVSIQNRAG